MKLLSGQIQTVFLGKLVNDGQVFVLIRHRESDFQAKTVGQGGDGFERIAHMDIVPLTLREAFTHQMATVGGGIQDQGCPAYRSIRPR